MPRLHPVHVASLVALLLTASLIVPASAAPLCFPKQAGCPDGRFHQYWEQHGGLRRHGLPLTDAYAHTGQSVQYLERSRLEWNAMHGAASQLQLGLVGSELYVTWNRWE